VTGHLLRKVRDLLLPSVNDTSLIVPVVSLHLLVLHPEHDVMFARFDEHCCHIESAWLLNITGSEIDYSWLLVLEAFLQDLSPLQSQ